MDRVVDVSECGASFGEVRINDLDFADGAVIFADTLALTGALVTLSEEAEPLGLRVSWVKTEIQEFGKVLDAATEPCRVAVSRRECGGRGEVHFSRQRSSLIHLMRSRGRSSTWPRTGSD